jgi:hypothetical protein
MALADFLRTNIHDSNVVGRLDNYLLRIANVKNDDRRWDVNSPSMMGRCKRQVYYSRINADGDNDITARTMRIFDNGSKVHERLEHYLLDAGVALTNEIPVRHHDLMIMGHADLIIHLADTYTVENPFKYTHDEVNVRAYIESRAIAEIAVGEIKSINANGFANLRDAKPEHKAQAMAYLVSMEARRKYLKKKFKSYDDLVNAQIKDSYKNPIFADYDYLQDGSKYTRAQKINHKVSHFMLVDLILFLTTKPVSKMVFIYESKDTQEIKEYTVEASEEMLNDVDDYMMFINNYVRAYRRAYRRKLYIGGGIVSDKDKSQLIRTLAPPQEGTKSSQLCRYCSFKTTCHGQ